MVTPVFPLVLFFALVMHLHQPADIFQIKFTRAPYASHHLFSTLVNNGAKAFIQAHVGTYVSVPFMLITLLVMAIQLYKMQPVTAIAGIITGAIGVLALSGFFAIWLSFTSIAHVSPEYYDGARATLAVLTNRSGVLNVITKLAYLSFVGLIILAIGLYRSALLSATALVFIVMGSLIIPVFWGIVNWMLLGCIFIFIGLFIFVRKLH